MKKGEAVALLCVLFIGWLSFISILSIGNTSEIKVNLTKIESIYNDISEIKNTLLRMDKLLRDKL
jgi:hypothetical protein